MGRPDQPPSPRMNNNFNPVFHQQPAPQSPVHMIQTDQRYPYNGGMVNQPNQVPMGRPFQPTVYQPNQVPMVRPFQPTVYQPNQVPMVRPVQPYGVPMVRPVQPYGVPMVTVVHPQPSNWTTGLCDCMDDCGNAIITFCFPCVTFGQIAEVIDEGTTSCGTAALFYSLIFWCIALPIFIPCATCIYTYTYRTKLRSKFGLPEAPAPDWMTHFFCEYCALCQAYRELNNRGLDPAIGWIGNVQKQRLAQQQQMMVPPVGQRMI